MPSSEMSRRVSLVRNDISEERVSSFFSAERIRKWEAANVVDASRIPSTLEIETKRRL
jgi:hypothetical protein